MSEPSREAAGQKDNRTGGISWSLAATLVFIVALAIRLAVVADLADLPSQHALVEDARAYDTTARELLANGWMPEDAFWQSPLYPYFIAVCYRVLGTSPITVRLLQALVGALAALVLAVCGRRLGGPVVGLVIGLLAALFAPFLFYTPLLLKPTLLVLFESLFILSVLSLGSRRSPWLVVGAGLSLGMAVLLRGNLLLLVPFLLIWWVGEWFSRRTETRGAEPRRLLRELVLLGGGFAAALLPVSLVNFAASGEFVLSSSNSGTNFYIGNREGASGIYGPLVPGRQSPEFEQEDALSVAAEIIGREGGESVDTEAVSAVEVSRAFWRQGMREIAAAPASWIRLLGRKFMLFWNAYEIPDAESFDVYRLVSPWLRWNPVLFGLIAPLGLLGLWLRYRSTGDLFFPAMVLASVASVVLFFVFGRFRLPVVPFLLPPAAWASVELIRLGRDRRVRELLGGIAALLVAVTIVWWPLVSREFRQAQLGIAHFNLGAASSRLLKESLNRDLGEASRWAEVTEEHLASARAADPAFLPTEIETVVLRLRQGNLAERRNRPMEARERYREAQDLLNRVSDAGETSSYRAVVTEARSQLEPEVWRATVRVDLNLARQLNLAGDSSTVLRLLREAEVRLKKLETVGAPGVAGYRAEVQALASTLGEEH